MKDLLKHNPYLYLLIFLIGSAFLVQCDRDADRDSSVYQEEQEGQVESETPQDQTADRYGESELSQDEQMQNFEDQRDEFIADLDDLRNNINAELERRQSGEQTDIEESEVATEEIESDLNELDNAISELRNTTESDWNSVRSETQQLYDRLSTRYEQEVDTDDFNQ